MKILHENNKKFCFFRKRHSEYLRLTSDLPPTYLRLTANLPLTYKVGVWSISLRADEEEEHGEED